MSQYVSIVTEDLKYRLNKLKDDTITYKECLRKSENEIKLIEHELNARKSNKKDNKCFIEIIKIFAVENNIPYWETPYEQRKTERGLYILYDNMSDGDCIMATLYRYKEDEEFTDEDIILSVGIDTWEEEKLLESRLQSSFLTYIKHFI